MNIDLAPAHRETVSLILTKAAPECEVLAFGSRVKGNARKYSDLDLVIKGNGPLSFRKYAQLRLAFEDSPLPISVDILDWHTIPERFRQNIEKNCVVIQEGAKKPGPLPTGT